MIKPRKGEVKKFMPILEQDYDSPEQASEVMIARAYELYQGQATWFLAGQVVPGDGEFLSLAEADDSKVLIGPFGTEGQARRAGEQLSYSTQSGEAVQWGVLKAHYGSPAEWHKARRDKYKRETLFSDDPRKIRQAMREQWMQDHAGAPLPEALKGDGWESLEEFQTWLDEGAVVDDFDLHVVILEQQRELNKLRGLARRGDESA